MPLLRGKRLRSRAYAAGRDLVEDWNDDGDSNLTIRDRHRLLAGEVGNYRQIESGNCWQWGFYLALSIVSARGPRYRTIIVLAEA